MGYFQMTRNVEEIFGGVVTAPHQIPYTYTSVNGGETFLSLPFYPITGFVTINGGVQVPLDNFFIESNILHLGRSLEPDDVVFCLFDKIISPEDTSSAIRIYKMLTTGGETEFIPDFTAYGVQTLFVDGRYKVPGVDYTYDPGTGKVTMTSPLPANVWVSAEMSVKQNVSALSGNDGASKVGTSTGISVQEVLDAFKIDITENADGIQQNADDIADFKLLTGAGLIGGLSFISPEMYGAKGDGVADDTAAVQAAIEAAKTSGKYRVCGMGRYRLFGSLKLDNLGQGFYLNLQTIIADASFPATSDWKTANGMIEVGGASNGSMVGVEVRIGFAHGNNVATLFKLKGYGAGGSFFWGGRITNCVGVFDCTNSTQANSNSNFIEGLYWMNGTYGIRLRRSGSFVVEAPKIRVGFMTGLRYGGIQLFNGTQYFAINATGMDFCGRFLTQLSVNALPPVSVRETMLTNDTTSATFEVLDVYEQTQGNYSILVIEPVSSEGGSTNFSVGQTVTVGGVQYTISAVTTSVTANAYFDFIHGFQGAPFSRGYAQFDYLSRAVGGNFNGTAMFWYNSFQEVNHAINNIWFRQQGTSISIVDRWTGTSIKMETTGGKATTLPGGVVTQGTSTIGGQVYLGAQRVFGSENNVNLAQGVATNIRTLTWTTDGTVITTKKSYRVVISGPNGLSGVGGSFDLQVSPNGAEIIDASGVKGITLSVSGFTLVATQGSQPTMNVTFMFKREM